MSCLTLPGTVMGSSLTTWGTPNPLLILVSLHVLSSGTIAWVPGAWLSGQFLTLHLREFHQKQEGIADGGTDGHRPSKQQVGDRHQQVLLCEFCAQVLFLLSNKRNVCNKLRSEELLSD